MTTETATGWWATQARESLRHAGHTATREFPELGDDRPSAAAEVLDELAGLVELVSTTVTATVGHRDGTVDRLTEQLAAALLAHRNLQRRRCRA